MSFKDLSEADNAIFFNTDEFGELHTVDGVQLPVVLDNEKLMERQANSEYGYQGGILFYVAKSTFGKVPAVGQIMNFDNRPWMVADVQEATGLLTITLESNMS
jgi:hypothetical protein